LKNPIYVEYHDKEWGVPEYEDAKLYELLVLEPFQAGLSWETILNKRENFRQAFDGFNPEIIKDYGAEKIAALMENKGIIRNRRKIDATIGNAKAFLEIQKEWGSFSDYIWHFTNGQVIYEANVTSSPLSDEISKDLIRRGMRFVGTTIVYSYLQAIGVIYSHDEGCYLYMGVLK
jgi:DNA-3-methyladenine glycosylase I